MACRRDDSFLISRTVDSPKWHYEVSRHELLDVTLAYLKGKDAESEKTQEHANSSRLALYALYY